MFTGFWQALAVISCIIKVICANTEKVLFTSSQDSILLNTSLPRIVPDPRTKIGEIVFELETPWVAVTSAGQYTAEQWFSVENLGPGWNYEARVCWPAIVRIMHAL